MTDGIWPHSIGGMQKHSFYICRYFSRLGINLDVYYTGDRKYSGSEFGEVFSDEEIRFIKFIYVKYPPNFRLPGHYLLEMYVLSRRIFRVLRENIHSYNFVYIQGFVGWYTLLYGKNRDYPPLVLNFHGLNMFQPSSGFRAKILNYIFKISALTMLKRSDHVQSLGRNLTKLLVQNGISPGRIFELGIGIEKEWFAERLFDQKNPVRSFIFVGRYDVIKGIRELNEVLSRLIKTARFYFHFVGSFPLENRIIAPEVFYHGEIRDENHLRTILDTCDFLVLPSYSEGMPTVVLEAMARGCAVIASDVGVLRQLVSPENGFLIAPRNTDDLERAMLQAIDISGERLGDMKRKSLDVVRGRFNWEDIALKMIDIIEMRKIKSV